jgi:hypothetical protein
VLPTIRKHGAYLTDAVLEDAIKSQEFAFELLRKLQVEKGKTAALLDKVETLVPKARYCDNHLMSGGVVPVSIIAKDYGMSAIEFNRLLHHLGIQFKLGGAWLLYSVIKIRVTPNPARSVFPAASASYHTTYGHRRGGCFCMTSSVAAGFTLWMNIDGDFEEDLA